MYNNIFFIRVATFVLTLKLLETFLLFLSLLITKTLILKMETLILQPQTLIILAELVKYWNQDPASQNNSLIITTNQVAITDGKEIILSLQFPLESEEQIQNSVINNDETEITPESLELEPDGNLAQTDTENTNEELFFSLEPEDT